jgi:arginyl-tRNA synthetase
MVETARRHSLVDIFKSEIAARVGAALGLPANDVLSMLEAPKDTKRGDVALPCFKLVKPLAREGKTAAVEIAKEIAAKTDKGDLLAVVEATGPFVNFKLAPGAMAASVLKAVAKPGRYGGSDEGKGKKVVIDYSSPNIAKAFHLGHLRSTVIGHSIRRLYESLGYEVVGVNHLGDWGTQFGFMMAAWQRWKDEAEQRIAKGEGEIDVFVSLYVRINKLAKEDPKVRDEARSWFKRLEQGDAEARRLWSYFVERSKKEFDRIYAILRIHHESDAGESFYEDKMKPVVELLRQKGLLVRGKTPRPPMHGPKASTWAIRKKAASASRSCSSRTAGPRTSRGTSRRRSTGRTPTTPRRSSTSWGRRRRSTSSS